MSATVYLKKRIPLSVSLGITTKLTATESLLDEMFSSLSFEKQEVLLFNTSSLAIIYLESNHNREKQNELSVFLAVRRAFGLKNHTKLPVVLVVKNQHVGKEVAEELARHSTDYKLYNMMYALRNKLNKDLITKETQQADFILLTYKQLRDVVFKKALPTTEQIVYINPLTKYNCHREVITLDNIKDGLHRHKCRKPHFTYILDAKSFPVFERKDYQHLLKVDDCLFSSCKEKPLDLFNNKLDSIKHLFDEHFWFFVLRELFRKRNNLEGLVERFKKTLTYKLHLFANGITPQNLENSTGDILDRDLKVLKIKIDKKIRCSINKTLLLFSKKTSKTIIGKENYDLEHDNIEYSWEDPIETPAFFPLIEKKKDRQYYLTKLGHALLVGTSNFAGANENLTSLLHRMAYTLFRKKESHPKFSIEEILRCYNLLIGSDTFELPITIKDYLTADDDFSVEELSNQLNRFIGREFGYIINDYSNHSALEFLGAFKDFMDEKALFLYKKLKELKDKKKRSKEKSLPEAILNAVKNKPKLIGEVSRKVRAGYRTTSRELAKLAEKGLVLCIKTIKSDGSIRLKYCQPAVLERFTYLKKNCGICAIYKKRFRKCKLFELLARYNSTTIPTEYLEYVCNYICDTATACENIVELSDLEIKGEEVKYTITKEELEQKIRVFERAYVLGQEVQIKYSCVNCEEDIEEFGTGEELFFPRKRILCPNCATGYYKKSDQLILIQTEHRDILRKKYFEVAGSVPKVLEELKPSYAYTIYDNEHADLVMDDDGSLILEICNQRVPLEKVQGVYFAGQQHTELEEFLKYLVEAKPERFTIKIYRSKQKGSDQIDMVEGCEPFSPEQYQMLHKITAHCSKEELITNSILTARSLSTISGLLGYQKFLQEKNECLTKVNRQLYETIDLCTIVRSGVKSSYYGRQLEAQSQNCIFDLIKEEGIKVDLWTHGRVLSRLVKSPFISSTIKISNARSPLDALINQVLRQFRFVINKIFRKVGFEPSSMGAGLLHRRETKSDIDLKGLYFDLIESVGTLALFAILKALSNRVLNDGDCYLGLDGSGQEVYRVKNASIEKIEELVEDALNELVFYNGKSMSFLDAYEQNLLSFRKGILLCFDKIEENNNITSGEIIQCLKLAEYMPFVYCLAECNEELKIVFDFAAKNMFFFEGREEQVLAARKKRNEYRNEAKKKWITCNGKRGKRKIRLTKHQQKEQERSLVIALTLMILGLQMNGYFGHYSTCQIQDILDLTQNQTQRILTQMVTQELLVKMKYNKQNYYQLNLENEAVHELFFTIGRIPSDDERTDELLKNSVNVLSRVKDLLQKFQQQKEGLHVIVGWRDWGIPISIEKIFDNVSEQVTLCKMND